MNITDVQLQILRIDAGSEPERCDGSTVRVIFEVGGSSFLASYSRGPRIFTSQASRRMLVTKLLADVISPHTVISKLSEVDASTAVIRLLPRSESALATWRSSMSSLHAQAVESIGQEGVLCESWFSFYIDDDAFLFAVMLRSIGIRAEEKDATSDLEIDRHHRAFKASWDRTLRIACRPWMTHTKIQD
ncbi:hypothetical protein RT97_29895 [Variovorax paradoxus]|uniref:Uncharacterized protein n=1 Tax=Variovorax paradoxus TaxID=34073 RepID=A0A0D0LJY9_VARPD|nr:DUF6176 family protein [Variovorax paradoxus]KIQ17795.1 hypothetical protein RT97_29895 [Variovorax paradoxus]